MCKKIWFEEDIKWLKENYPIYGSEKLSSMGKFSRKQIRDKVSDLKLNLSPQKYIELTKHVGHELKYLLTDEYLKVSEDFINFSKPEHVYILGLLWADGYITKIKGKYAIVANFIKTDGLEFLEIFQKTTKWCFMSIKPSGKTPNEGLKIFMNNKWLHKFLKENDYENKTYVSPDKILSKIPDNLKHYWWRGYFDGDGFVNYRSNQIVLVGHLKSDLSFIENLLNSLSINYKIRIINKNGSGGILYIISKPENFLPFFNFIYPFYEYDQIGLKRKYDTFIIRLNKINLKSLK